MYVIWTDPVFSLEQPPYRIRLNNHMHVCLGLRVISIPPGFCSDLASVPRAGLIFWRPFGPWAIPAFIHDWLYWDAPVSRSIADLAFRSALRTAGVSPITRFIFYSYVRLFGAIPWRRYRRLNQEAPLCDRSDSADYCN